jgi:hypothetical protein
MMRRADRSGWDCSVRPRTAGSGSGGDVLHGDALLNGGAVLHDAAERRIGDGATLNAWAGAC